jgi:eukaryotic-like serine/threonine-protein kinase
MDKNRLRLVGYYSGIGFGIILVTAFVTSQILMPIFFGREKTVEIPNVVNLQEIKAKSTLISHKLHVVVRDSTYSDTVERGMVVSQKPEAGNMIKPDGTVYLIVSAGSKYIAVPELIGLNVQSAWLLLKNNGLRFTIADSLNSDLYPINTVVQSNPLMGTKVERRTKVKLYISKGRNNQPDTLNTDDYVY